MDYYNKERRDGKKIADSLCGEDQNQQPLIDALIEMARWKDNQLKHYLEMMYIQNKAFFERGLMTTENFVIREKTINCILEELLNIKDVRKL